MGVSSVQLVVDQTFIQDGNQRFSVLGGATVECGGGAQIGFSCLRLGNDLIQDGDRHRSQQLNLGDVDPKGTLELGTGSSGYNVICVSKGGKTESNYAVYLPGNPVLTRTSTVIDPNDLIWGMLILKAPLSWGWSEWQWKNGE